MDKTKNVSESLNYLSAEIVDCLKVQKNQGELFPDLVLQVENAEISCHRFTLSACSGFFRGLLVSGMKEDQQQRVTVTGISLDIVQLVLDMIYTGENLLTEDNMIDVWHAANQLEILFLLRFCESFITNHINDVNCCEIYENGKLLDSKLVTSSSWEYILSHFETVRLTHDILELPLKDVMPLIQSQNLFTKNEDHVIDFILKWVNYNPSNQNKAYPGSDLACDVEAIQSTGDSNQLLCASSNINTEDSSASELTSRNVGQETETENQHQSESSRDTQKPADDLNPESVAGVNNCGPSDRWNNLADLFEATRFCLLSSHALTQLLSNHRITTNERTMCLVKENIAFHSTRANHEYYIPAAGLCRSSDDLVHAIVWVADVSQWNKNFSLMNVEDMKVVPLRLEKDFSPVGLAVYKNMIYIVESQKCNKFDYIFNNFTSMENFEFRDGHTVARVDDFLYLVGGSRQAIERLNMARKSSWTNVGSLPVAAIFTTAAVIETKIVVLGCSSDQYSITTAQCFNAETGTAYHIQDIYEPSQNINMFNKCDKAYALFSSGNLWVFKATEDGRVSANYVAHLQSCNKILTGCVLAGDTLHVFDSTSAAPEPAFSIEVPGIFKHIHHHHQPMGQFFRAICVPRQFF